MTFRSEILFVRILIPFTTGIWFAYGIKDQSIFELIFPAVLIIYLLLGLANSCYKKLGIYNFSYHLGLFIHFSWFVFGIWCCWIHHTANCKDYFDEQAFQQLKGFVSNEPQQKNRLLRAEVTLTTGYHNRNPKKISGKLMLLVSLDSLNKSHKLDLQYGDEILVTANQTPIEPAGNPGEFDFKAWLATKQIYHQLFVKEGEISKLSTKNGSRIIAFAIRLRKSQVAIYRKLIRNDEAFAVASTLVLGYRTDLNKDTLAAYSKTGTIHALSVSGMHVGIIYIFLNWALSFLDRSRFLKIIKLLLICLLIWSYSLLTGFSPSVLRSAVMLTIFILAKAMNKNSNSHNILAFTAFVLLYYDPYLLYDVGFQLSFLAVFGLIYLQPKIYKLLQFKSYWLDQLWSSTALSLSAQFTTFPLSIYYFHQFPLYFLFSNLFILLPLTLMMYLGIAILLLRLYFLAPIFEWIIIFTNQGLKWISTLPFSGIDAIWINQAQLCLLSISAGLLVYALVKSHKKILLLGICTLLLLSIYTSSINLQLIQQQKIIFFGLRRHFAAAFISGPEAVIVTDLQPGNQIFEFSIRPALDQLKVQRLHLVDWEKDTTTDTFIKQNHQILFHNYKILLLDQHLDKLKPINLPNYQLGWIHQNPHLHLQSIGKATAINTFISDASNHSYSLARYSREVNKSSLRLYNLKKNKAYLIDLKHYHE